MHIMLESDMLNPMSLHNLKSHWMDLLIWILVWNISSQKYYLFISSLITSWARDMKSGINIRYKDFLFLPDFPTCFSSTDLLTTDWPPQFNDFLTCSKKIIILSFLLANLHVKKVCRLLIKHFIYSYLNALNSTRFSIFVLWSYMTGFIVITGIKTLF